MSPDKVFVRCSFCEDGLVVDQADVAQHSTDGKWLCSVCREIPEPVGGLRLGRLSGISSEIRTGMDQDDSPGSQTVTVRLSVDGREDFNLSMEWNPLEEPLVALVERMAITLALASEERSKEGAIHG